MNGNFEACSTNATNSSNNSGTGSNDQPNNKPPSQGEGQPTSSSEALSHPSNTYTGEPSRNGSSGSWSYDDSEQYRQQQQEQYPQYDYPQEQEQGHQSYYQEAGSEDVYYQGQQYYGEGNYEQTEEQQPQRGQVHQQGEQLHQEQQELQPGEKQQDKSKKAEGANDTTQQPGLEEEERGKCWECGSAFQDDELLRDHLALFHTETQIFKCHTCPAVFPSQSSLTKHITTTHLVGASIQSANKSQSEEEEEYSEEEEEEEEEEETQGVSISGGGSLQSLLGKGISVSSSDTSLSALQAKGIAISSSSSALSSLKGKGISISGSSDSSLSSLEGKGLSISSQGQSPLKSLTSKGVSISDQGESPLKALQAKGISIGGADSSEEPKGVSVSGSSSALSLLQSKGISVSGNSETSLAALQSKGISISGNSDSETSSGDNSSSSLALLQAKGISVSGRSESLSSLQAKGISISGSSDTSLSSLQAKGISIGGADSSSLLKGVSVSGGGESALSLLQSKGISISGASTSLQAKDSGRDSPLSSLQGKGISVSSSSSSLAFLKAKGISISGAGSSLQGKASSSAESSDQEEEEEEEGNDDDGSSAAKSDTLSSLQSKGITLAPAKTALASLQGKGLSISSANPALSLLQQKGISLTTAGPRVSSPLSKESSPSSSATSSPVPPTDPRGVSTFSGASHLIANSQPSSLQGTGFSVSSSTAHQAFSDNVEASSSNQAIPPHFAKAAPRSVVFSRVAYLKAKGFDCSSIRQPSPLPINKETSSSSPLLSPKPNVRGSFNRRRHLGCVYCHINRFKSEEEFDEHHTHHANQTSAKIILIQVDPKAYEASVKRKKSSDLKLKLRISKVGRGRGRKRRKVQIVSKEEGMSESHKSLEEQEGLEAENQEEEEGESTGAEGFADEDLGEGQSEKETEEEASRSSADYPVDNLDQGESSGHVADDQQQGFEQEESGSNLDNTQQERIEEENSAAAQRAYNTRSGSNQNNDNTGSGFNNNFNEQDLSFGSAGSSEAPPSTYQPQFESFPTSDWFSEYESGSRIVAAMAGATTAEPASDGNWGANAEGAPNPEYTSANTEKDGTDSSANGRPLDGGGEDGLFSQAVLGQESPDKNGRQGSFEQLCLNDSYSGQQGDGGEGQTDQVQGDFSQDQQQQDQQQSGATNDLLSELEYLNNSGQPPHSAQVDGSPHSGGPSPHSAGPGTPSHLSSRGSNSGTPTSSGGHPTPPPTDTSFRALATSPTQATSPSLQGQTPPATSPLQQGGEQQQPGIPRLTIANNLLAPTTSSQITPGTDNSQAGVGGMMTRYGNQWPQGAGYTGSTGYGNMAGSNMSGPLRPPLPPNVGMPYRPSPPARVRGRPPLMGQIGRPPLHQGSLLQPARGPGRPPASSILPPPLMPAPGGRSSIMPPLQRMHQNVYQGARQPGPQQNGAAKRPLMGGSGHSPSKNARREDINVPSRQKDNDCQIIAVANRSDGLPVIANVQGGSGSSRGSAPMTSSESTINLSDSITLSVRSNEKSSQRGERGGGDTGTVANLLASRGITVTPAAGERQDGAGGGRDDRRLPTAQELNLSSAISVHPPTQREREASGGGRDRDGFAVPQAPVRGSSTTNSVERPPRPPTVDLTQEVSPSGHHGARHHCSQCERSFPTATLLADHTRVHQQHQQARMPYKCHLCTAGFSTQKGQQHHYQQFHQIHLSAGDIAIPLVDLRNPVNVQRMAALGIRSFLPLTNLQNRGAGGVIGIPVLTLENLRNGHMTLQQWGVSDVLSLGPAKTLNMPR